MIENWALYFALFSSFVFFSQEQLKNLSKNALQPGTTTSISFKVDNTTSEDKRYDVFIEASKPFISPILTRGELTIAAGQSKVYVVPIHLASETPQGLYTLSLYVTDKQTGDKRILQAEIPIAVKYNLSITTLTSPEYVKAGQPIKASFLLKNSGNIIEKISLTSNAKLEENEKITLPPGQTRVITVTQQTDPKLGKNGIQVINLSAHTDHKPEENILAYSSVNIFSVKPTEVDVFHRFPISLSLNYLSMRNIGEYQKGYQTLLYGKGSLDKENKDIVEFRAITANPITYNAFTQYEEYFFNYTRDGLFVHFGDKTYSSSFLTEYARYGRGLELSYRRDDITIGGFFSNPRFFEDIKTEFNVYSKYEFKNKAEITAGYFRKMSPLNNPNTTLSRLSTNASLPYLKGSAKLFKKVDVLAELAYSQTKDTKGMGYMLQVQGNFKKVNGGFIYMKTSPHFSGYFNQSSTLNGNINYNFLKKMSLFANVMQDVQNFQRDNLLLAAPYRNMAQLGLNYNYHKYGSILLYSGYQSYQDRMALNRQFDYKEQFVRASINQKINIFQLGLESQFGKTENYLANFTGNTRLYTANLGVEKFKTSVNVYGSLAQTSRYQTRNQTQVYYGVRTTSRFSDKTYLSLFYQNNYQPEEYYQDRNLLEALFHQQIFRGHEVDLSGRYTLQHGLLGDKDFIVSVRYTFRLNAPAERIAKYTSLSGNIHNLGVQKTNGVKLNLGNHTAITDEAGNYVFKNMPPGDYYLDIDKLTTDLNDIATVNTPISINLVDKPNTLNFGLTTSASIKGHITFSENKANTSIELPTKENEEKNSILIEVSNGEQVFRKIGTLGDDFDFTYLRPGDWIVKLYRNGLNNRYKIATDTFQFTLEPSETKQLNIEITEKSKEIKYQQAPIKVEYKGFKK